ALRDFIAREEKLAQDHRLKLARERRQHEQVAGEDSARAAATLAEAEAAFQSAKSAAEARYEQRKTRIARARQSTKERTLEKIETKTGSRKYELQKRMLQAGRDRESGLAGTVAAFQEFDARLAVEKENLEQLLRSEIGNTNCRSACCRPAVIANQDSPAPSPRSRSSMPDWRLKKRTWSSFFVPRAARSAGTDHFAANLHARRKRRRWIFRPTKTSSFSSSMI